MRAMTGLGVEEWNSGKLRGEYSMASCTARRRDIAYKIKLRMDRINKIVRNGLDSVNLVNPVYLVFALRF
jgi:hypothetical protein